MKDMDDKVKEFQIERKASMGDADDLESDSDVGSAHNSGLKNFLPYVS